MDLKAKNLKFHGLSSPEDLIEMWRILKRDDDTEDLNIIWDYTSPKQVEKGFNVINILYDPKAPEETGHYCLIYNDTAEKKILFYNPVATYTDMNEDKLKDLLEYFKDKDYPVENILIDLSGRQSATSENCGYHCLAKAFTIYTDYGKVDSKKPDAQALRRSPNDDFKDTEEIDLETKAGAAKDKPTDSAEELLYSILKNVRGIYFGLRDGWENTAKQKKKKETASGLADYVNHGEKWSYSRLRNEVEK
jgi:hypothetical protein